MRSPEHLLFQKIKILNDVVWERKATKHAVDAWLSNFREEDRSMSLYLLSNFIYFGNRQMRELMGSLYRDLYKYPIIHEIRKKNNNTLDHKLITAEFGNILKKTKFIGIGNPSESGCHLLYYLRQENNLPKTIFSHTHELFSRKTTEEGYKELLRYPEVDRYVFIDDFCGTGHQTASYMQDISKVIKKLKPDASLLYFVLFGTTTGLNYIKTNTSFDIVDSVIELDQTFKVFGPQSRYFTPESDYSKSSAEEICIRYGEQLISEPLGYGNCQLLLGFHHNIPDNTLPIIWFTGPYSEGKHWVQIFKRYDKKYT